MNKNRILIQNIVDKFLYSLMLTSIFVPICMIPLRLIILLCIINISTRIVINNECLAYVGKNKIINLFFIFYLSIALLSILWVNDFDLYYKKMFDVINHTFVFYIVFYNIFVKKNLITFTCYFLLFIAIIYCTVSFWEILTIQHFSCSHYYGKPIPIPTGFFINENNQAMILLFIFPFLIYLYKYVKSKFIKILIFTVMLSMFTIVCIESARLVIMAFAPILIYFIFFKLPKIVSILFVVFFLLTMGYLSRYKSEEYTLAKEYMAHQYRSIGEEKNGIILGSTKSRINMLKRAVMIFGKQPLLGAGAGSYDYIVRNDDYSDVEWIENTHNYFFETLANYGIIVFMSLILFWLTITTKLLSIYSSIKQEKNKTFVICSIIFMIFFIFGSSIPSSMTNLYQCWVMFGLIVAFLTENDVCEKNFYEKK